MKERLPLRHKEIEIDLNEPFKNCQLGRKVQGENLEKIIDAYESGFVLDINNEWGAGKTTFIKMWQQLLKNKGYKTIYYNAWEDDYKESPVVGLLALIGKELDSQDPSLVKTLKSLGAKVLYGLAKKATVKAFGYEENIPKDAVDKLDSIFDDYLESKDEIKALRECLQKAADEISKQKDKGKEVKP